MPPSRRVPIIIVLALAFIASGSRAAKVGDLAPALVLTDLQGKAVKLADLRGKVVLVDFWASWCVPCRKEIPLLDEMARKYTADGKPLVVLAINVDQDRGNAEKLLRELKVSTLVVALDPDGKAAAAFDVPTMPSSFVVDSNGDVRLVHAGFEPGDERDLAAAVDQALARVPR